MFDITERVREAYSYYDKLLDERLDLIAKLSGVPREKLLKINPAAFIALNKSQKIEGYEYIHIGKWLEETKEDDNYLISPLDDPQLTANQIAYKEKIDNVRIRASKCQIIPIPAPVALDFFVRNHRQSLPNLSELSVSFGLVYKGQLVGVMTYDKTAGGVRGKAKAESYELLRLAFAHSFSLAGGASRLQKHCEQALRELGCHKIFSYSNATINNGRVYAALGFEGGKIDGGQPFVIMKDNRIVRLLSLYPNSTDFALARAGRIKTHIGGNKLWTKEI